MPASRVPRLSIAHALAAAVVLPSVASAQTAADTPVSLTPITVSASALNRLLERMTQPAVVLDEDQLIERRGATLGETL